MKELTTSIFSFEKLIRGKYLYVDKTEYIWQLIENEGESYFLSRPRRFGKSLTLSTLKAVFEGKKELFRGLAIYDKPYDWKPYPIIHLSFGDYSPINNTAEKLNLYFLRKVKAIAKDLTVSLTVDDDASQAFAEMMNIFKEKNQQVVILIDEYDKPILDNVTEPNIKEIQKCLKGFYSVLKDRNSQERLLFITGVSKFCHVSLFSDLNNLTDITLDADEVFDELQRTLIKRWYNGYRFEENAKTVYNPVSLAQFFQSDGKFKNYWFATGTPTFLLELMKKQRFDLEKALTSPVSNLAFDAYEIDRLNPLTLLVQTGYLTIDSTVKRFGDTTYRLRFPNLEVKGAFETYLAGYCSGLFADQVKDSVYQLADAVTAGDVDSFMETMKVFFAKVPYDVHLKDENNFQLLFFSIFMLLGISITAESKTNQGRIDAVATNEGFVFVFEFKLDKSKEMALEQIKDRDYYRRYMNSGKKIILIGVNFDMEKGQIQDWTSQTV